MSKIPSSITTLSTDYAPLFWYVAGQGLVQGTLAQLVSYIEDNISLGKPEYVKQYSTPVAAATVEVTAGSSNYWLILTPAGTLATLTIELPLKTNLTDNQEILVVSTQEITTLTVDKNDTTNIFGEPTTLAAEGYFKMKYNSFQDIWYRVG